LIQAVIFDMDGLLVDSEPVWFEARRELLARFGKQWAESDQERMMGVSTSVWVGYVTEKLSGAMPRDEVLRGVVGIMAAQKLAAGQQFPQKGGAIDLPGVRPDGMNPGIVGAIGAVQRFQAQASGDVGR